ncbi:MULTISPECIES: hypothetical protein [unclassified Rhodococcus (in: high G+C Gram-positive bacteria)]|uniref:hypothetical protein n=1 Tax=unclassified Rhodococcus (in: high G+C Gram-positive bacteria) TaxID=192944 RepID=UPI00163AB945|nr:MULTISPECIES: hypothetical protein [unclassified Rhodococcus (in: high G+C Gram-positive bacteria)]MBC2639116.1 hypothetical protein [Rhodococcus sp. 3A]MBC2896142.1 hypothetical protein [Rhodococcus sp. 4CII]
MTWPESVIGAMDGTGAAQPPLASVPGLPPVLGGPEVAVVKVDPDMLRAMAGALGAVAREVEALGGRRSFDHAGRAVEGSDTAAACQDAGDVLASALGVAASRIDEMAYIAGDGAENYDVTDTSFAAQLSAMGEM